VVSTRQFELEPEVLEETVKSLVLVLVGGSEAKRPSVVTAISGLDVELSVVVDALLPVLEDIASTKVTSHLIICITRIWANAQRDGRPAEYRWRPLFNAAKFG